jgi:LemA protein
MSLLLMLVGGAGVVVLYGIIAYNALVRQRSMVEEAWSGIDAQLKRRANLIPNLVETVKGYASHETKTLEAVTEMRTRSLNAHGVQEQAAAEKALTAAIGGLFAVAEAYPDLKASANFSSLQDDLDAVENEIQMARRYYNGTVRNLNISIEQFPSNIVANQFGFEKAEFFEIEDDNDRAVPKVEF